MCGSDVRSYAAVEFRYVYVCMRSANIVQNIATANHQIIQAKVNVSKELVEGLSVKP